MMNGVIPSIRSVGPRPLLPLVIPSILLFAILLIYPVGPDQSIYMVGGRMIAKGAVYYRDILDVKPPPIHWITAAALGLFGDGITSLRLADLLLQSLTVVLLALYLRRTGRSDLELLVGTTLYALGYLALGTEGTYQPESWCGLCIVTALLLRQRGDAACAFAIGLIGALLFALKFTMLLPLLAFVIVPPSDRSNVSKVEIDHVRTSRHHPLLILAGFALGIAIFLAVIAISGGGDGLRTTMSFLSGRQSWTLAHENPFELIVRGTAHFFLTVMGPVPTVLGLVAITVLIRRGRVSRESVRVGERGGVRAPCIEDAWLIALIALLLLVSAVAELMALPYQLGRMILPLTLLTICGVSITVDRLSSRWPKVRRGTWIRLLMFATVVFGALPRIVVEVRDALEARRLSDGLSHPLFLSDGDQRTEYIRLVDYLEEKGNSDDQDAILSGYAGYLSLLRSSEPSSGLLHGHQLIARFSPSLWRDRFLSEIEEKQPHFLLVDRNDSAAAAFVGGDPSIEWLWRALRERGLDRVYREGYRSNSYVVLERIDGTSDSIR